MPTVDISIDFDFFVREDPMWDFGHAENNLFHGLAWSWRYHQIDLYAETDPAVHADLLPRDLLRRLFAKGPDISGFARRRVACANSHKEAYGFFLHRKKRGDMLVNIDAHHDWFNRKPEIDCGNWLASYAEACPSAKLVQVYPKWKDIAHEVEGLAELGGDQRLEVVHGFYNWALPNSDAWHLGDVFLCFSGAWVPPHHFTTFVALVPAFSTVTTRQLKELGGGFPVLREIPTRDECRADVARWKAMQQELYTRTVAEQTADTSK